MEVDELSVDNSFYKSFSRAKNVLKTMKRKSLIWIDGLPDETPRPQLHRGPSIREVGSRFFLTEEIKEARKAVGLLDDAVVKASSYREKASRLIEEAHRALTRLEQAIEFKSSPELIVVACEIKVSARHGLTLVDVYGGMGSFGKMMTFMVRKSIHSKFDKVIRHLQVLMVDELRKPCAVEDANAQMWCGNSGGGGGGGIPTIPPPPASLAIGSSPGSPSAAVKIQGTDLRIGKNDKVHCISFVPVPSPTACIWWSVGAMLEFYSEACDSTTAFAIEKPQIMSVTAVAVDMKDNVWTGHLKGLTRVRCKEQWDYIVEDTAGGNSVGHAVRSITFDNADQAWIGDEGGFIKVLNFDSNEKELQIVKTLRGPQNLQNNQQGGVFSLFRGDTDSGDASGGGSIGLLLRLGKSSKSLSRKILASDSMTGQGTKTAVEGPVRCMQVCGPNCWVSSGKGSSEGRISLWSTNTYEMLDYWDCGSSYGHCNSLKAISPSKSSFAAEFSPLPATSNSLGSKVTPLKTAPSNQDLSASRMLSGHENGQVLVWQVATSKLAPIISICEPGSPIRGLTVLEDANLVCVAHANGEIDVFCKPHTSALDLSCPSLASMSPTSENNNHQKSIGILRPKKFSIKAHRGNLTHMGGHSSNFVTVGSEGSVRMWHAKDVIVEAQKVGILVSPADAANCSEGLDVRRGRTGDPLKVLGGSPSASSPLGVSMSSESRMQSDCQRTPTSVYSKPSPVQRHHITFGTRNRSGSGSSDLMIVGDSQSLVQQGSGLIQLGSGLIQHGSGSFSPGRSSMGGGPPQYSQHERGGNGFQQDSRFESPSRMAGPEYSQLGAQAGSMSTVLSKLDHTKYQQHSHQVWSAQLPKISAMEGVGAGFMGSCQMIESHELSLKKVIGSGAYGKVYLAEWTGCSVAVKELMGFANNDDEGDAKIWQEMQNEVNMLGSLSHPNIMRFMAVCLDPPMIVMQYYAHGSLFGLLQRARKGDPRALREMTWGKRLEMLRDVAAGMHYLHTRRPSVIHGDLRSPNLLLDLTLDGNKPRFHVKIADFGLAKIINQNSSMAMLSKTTNPRWTAPEVIRDSAIGTAGDVYSFAIIMWEMLTWEQPYEEMMSVQVIFNAVAQNQRPDTPVDADLPGLPGISLQKYKSLMEKCWASEVRVRPSFKQIVEEFQVFRDMESRSSVDQQRAGGGDIVQPQRFGSPQQPRRSPHSCGGISASRSLSGGESSDAGSGKAGGRPSNLGPCNNNSGESWAVSRMRPRGGVDPVLMTGMAAISEEAMQSGRMDKLQSMKGQESGDLPLAAQHGSSNSPFAAAQQSSPSSPFATTQHSSSNSPFAAAQQCNSSSPFVAAQQGSSNSPFATAQQSNANSPFATTQQSSSSSPFAAAQQNNSNSPFAAAQQSNSSSPFAAAQQSSSNSPFATAQQSNSPSPFAAAQQSNSPSPFAAAQQSNSPSPFATAQQSSSNSPFATTQHNEFADGKSESSSVNLVNHSHMPEHLYKSIEQHSSQALDYGPQGIEALDGGASVSEIKWGPSVSSSLDISESSLGHEYSSPLGCGEASPLQPTVSVSSGSEIGVSPKGNGLPSPNNALGRSGSRLRPLQSPTTEHLLNKPITSNAMKGMDALGPGKKGSRLGTGSPIHGRSSLNGSPTFNKTHVEKDLLRLSASTRGLSYNGASYGHPVTMGKASSRQTSHLGQTNLIKGSQSSSSLSSNHRKTDSQPTMQPAPGRNDSPSPNLQSKGSRSSIDRRKITAHEAATLALGRQVTEKSPRSQSPVQVSTIGRLSYNGGGNTVTSSNRRTSLNNPDEGDRVRANPSRAAVSRIAGLSPRGSFSGVVNEAEDSKEGSSRRPAWGARSPAVVLKERFG